MKAAVLAAPVLVAVTAALAACAGIQSKGAPGPAPQAGPLAAPVNLSIRSVRTFKARLGHVRTTAPAIRLGDSRLQFSLATNSCTPVGVSAHAEARTLRLRLRPNPDACEDVLRVLDVVVTLSRPVLRTNALTRVAVTYAPLHAACSTAACRRPRAELLPLVWLRI
ncbi:MAG TPA: hypothetical protein VFM57_00825 [Thermoleophilaceae bacterium]|nr:hypothetical protein [Thermoleophilaceae bacterium]